MPAVMPKPQAMKRAKASLDAMTKRPSTIFYLVSGVAVKSEV